MVLIESEAELCSLDQYQDWKADFRVLTVPKSSKTFSMHFPSHDCGCTCLSGCRPLSGLHSCEKSAEVAGTTEGRVRVPTCLSTQMGS